MNESANLIKDDLTRIEKSFEKIYSDPNKPTIELTFPSFEIVETEIEIESIPGIYELIDINEFIQNIIFTNGLYTKMEFTIEADTRTMKSIIKSSNSFCFNSDFNLLMGFIEKKTIHLVHINLKNQ